MGVENHTEAVCVVRVALLHRLERREAGEHLFVKSGVVLADAAEDVTSTQKFAGRGSLRRRVRNIRSGASDSWRVNTMSKGLRSQQSSLRKSRRTSMCLVYLEPTGEWAMAAADLLSQNNSKHFGSTIPN